MPYFRYTEIWTPLKLIGIRFFIDDEGGRWIKLWRLRRKKIK